MMRLPGDDGSDDIARVIICSTPTDTTSIAEDILTLSSSSYSDGNVVVVGIPVIVVGFFRPGHGTHHWPKHSLIKAATVVPERAYLGNVRSVL